jgi:hypothetical protein
MGCRKNVKNLTVGEKSAFVHAVFGVAAKPSVLHPSDPGLNRYDDFVETHMNAMMAMSGNPGLVSFTPGWAHYAPAFFPWHRILVYEFEKELQSVDATVTVPYWDWADPASDPFTADFLGGAGTGPLAKVLPADGPFAHDGPTPWVLHVVDQMGDPDYLQRYLNGANPGQPFPVTLPTQAGDIDPVMAQTPYEVSPWKGFPSIDSCFRSHMEADLHNWIHNWVGGTMLKMTSPNDPVFWLHHCNIDRLWAVWLAQHPMAAAYLPPVGTLNVAPGHGINDTMIFFMGGLAPWPGTFTPAGSVDQHALGFWYDTDAPQVVLETPSVSFENVQQGIGATAVTTYRPIRFNCQSCGDVMLHITVQPVGPDFGASILTETVHPNHDPTSGLSSSEGALWVSYTTSTLGVHMDSVTVQAVDVNTGTIFGPWPVTLSATTVARQTSAVALVLDRSGSMSIDAGNGHPRVELLRTAVATFIDLMQQGDGLSIVRFDNLVDTLMQVTDVGGMGGAGRLQAQHIASPTTTIASDPANTLDPRGTTCIGGGITAGKAALDLVSGMYTNRAMIVLTDGIQNTHPYISEVVGLNDHTFAIGFGQAAAISTAALNEITQNHGGYLIVTGPITPEENFALTEYFLKIQAGINNSTAVLDPRGELIFGVTHRIPFELTTADHGVDVVLLSPAPYYIDFRLETPDGTIIDPVIAVAEPAMEFVGTPRVSYYRASLPMLHADPHGSHKGTWHVILSLSDRAKQGDRELIARLGRPALPYSVLVHAYSDLTFRPSLRQSGFEPGASVELRVALDQYDNPLDTPAIVWADVARPDGSRHTVMLSRTSAGRFAASFTADDIGVYTARIRAKGVTMDGEHFAREQRLTAVTFLGGNQPAQPQDRLCALLHCLRSGAAISADLERELTARGLSMRHLLACLEKECCGSDAALGGERPYDPNAAAAEPTIVSSAWRDALLLAEREGATAPSQFAQLVQGKPVPTPPAPAKPDYEKIKPFLFAKPPPHEHPPAPGKSHHEEREHE